MKKAETLLTKSSVIIYITSEFMKKGEALYTPFWVINLHN